MIDDDPYWEAARHPHPVWEALRVRHAAYVFDRDGRSTRYPLCCAVGWADLIDRFFTEVGETLKGSGERLLILDVKEKFGSLRIYHDIVTKPYADRIGIAHAEAQMLSYVTCEVCGADGRVRKDKNGWWATRCQAHAREGMEVVEGGPVFSSRELSDGSRLVMRLDLSDRRIVKQVAADEQEWLKLMGFER
jgi:hypothetical protein